MNSEKETKIKVAILTFHFVQNYGAVLQAYSLQKHLESIGCNPYILNYRTFKRRSVFYSSRIFRLPIPSIGKILLLSKQLNKNRKYRQFLEHHLSLSEEVKGPSGYISNIEEADAVVVGSDQVWNPKYGENAMRAYFLEGVSNSKIKFSYAACFGNSKISVSSLRNYLSNLNSFSGISVRDEFSRSILSSESHCSKIVVDPTLLIDWKSNKFDIDKPLLPFSGDYIFVYGFSSDIEEVCSILKRTMDIPLVAIGMEGELFFNGADYIVNDAGPIEWLEMLRGASYVITKSFHGVMFSVALEKQFLVVLDSGVSRERIIDFCNRFGANHRMLEKGNLEGAQEKLMKLEDFECINKILRLAIEDSKDFISRCLAIE